MYEAYLQELKDYLHILHEDDNDNLLRQLERSHAYIKGMCGEFELDNVRGRALVMDHARFAYNGQSDYFYASYMPEINMFGFSLYEPEEDDDGTP